MGANKKSISEFAKISCIFYQKVISYLTHTLLRGGVIMANIKSAKKRVLVNATKQARNKSANSALKTALKKANAAIEANADNKDEAVKFAVKKLDQATAKGLLHKNNAARKKSALVTKLNASK